MPAAHEGKTVKEFLMELAEAMLAELERKGILPKKLPQFLPRFTG